MFLCSALLLLREWSLVYHLRKQSPAAVPQPAPHLRHTLLQPGAAGSVTRPWGTEKYEGGVQKQQL